jgi:hypothetical protein
LEKLKKDWLGRCRPPSVAVGAQRFQRWMATGIKTYNDWQ